MNKNDFVIAFSSYEYFLRANVNPNLDLYIYSGDPLLNLNYSYYFIGTGAIYSLISRHLNSGFEINHSVVNDFTLKTHAEFFGLFIYCNDTDNVIIWGNADFKDGSRTVHSMVHEVDAFLNKTSSATIQLPIGTAINPFPAEMQSLPDATSLKVKSNCDCGAHILGYKDTDTYCHSHWCNVNSKKVY